MAKAPAGRRQNEMTPEERNLIDDLFNKLANLERDARDADAERAIGDGLRRAPNAVYTLVQTVLVQDEALRAANDHIAQLEQANRAPASSSRSFLGDRRDGGSGGGANKWNSGEVLRSSVPPVRSSDVPPPGYGRDDGGYGAPQRGPMGAPPSAPWGAPPMGAEPPHRGGFLGTAAAAAAGVVGGSLLMGGIRSALGGAGGSGPFSNTFDHLSRGGAGGTTPGGATNDLQRQAGLNDIGGRADSKQLREQDEEQDLDQDIDDGDYDDQADDDGGDDTTET
jgi:hypothetical protein